MADEKKGFLGTLSELFTKEKDEGPGPHDPLDPELTKIDKVPKFPGPSGAKGEVPYPMYIRYRGPIDLDGLYQFMANWLKDRKFELHETLYKFKPPELEIEWTGDRKKSGFIQEFIYVYFHMFGDYDIDVVEKGKRKRVSDGKMTIQFDMGIKHPYEDMFGERRWNSAMERRALRIFLNYVMKREIETLTEDILYYEVHKFQADVKNYLNLSTRGHVF